MKDRRRNRRLRETGAGDPDVRSSPAASPKFTATPGKNPNRVNHLMSYTRQAKSDARDKVDAPRPRCAAIAAARRRGPLPPAPNFRRRLAHVLGSVRPRLQPAVPADQAADHAQPAGRRMEAGRGDPRRDRPGRALPRQPGHGAQGDRRARHREPRRAPPGQGHLRRDARRRADPVPLPAPGAGRRQAQGHGAPLHRLQAHARRPRPSRARST